MSQPSHQQNERLPLSKTAKNVIDVGREYVQTLSAPTNSLIRRFARGFGWSSLGTLAWQGGLLLSTILVARLLGTESFGRYAAAQNTVAMAAVFATSGLSITATRYVAEYRARGTDTASLIRLLGAASTAAAGLVSAAVFVAARWIASSAYGNPALTSEIALSSAVVFVTAIGATQLGILAGLEAFHAMAYINLGRGILIVPLTIAGCSLGGVKGAILALLVTGLSAVAHSHVLLDAEYARHRLSFHHNSGPSKLDLLWRFSLPALLSATLTTPVLWIATSLLVRTDGGFHELAVFSAANHWRSAVAFLPVLLTQPLLPILSHVARDAHSFSRLLLANLMLTLGATIAVSLPIAIAAPWLMAAYGHSFRNGANVLLLLLLATILSSTVAVFGNAIASLEHMWVACALNLVWAIVFLLGTISLVPSWGASGLAIAYCAAYVVHSITVSWYGVAVLRAVNATGCSDGFDASESGLQVSLSVTPPLDRQHTRTI